MTQSKHDQMLALVEPLRNGQQCDEDGAMCIISRQLCHEAADALTAALDEIERLRELLTEATDDLTSYVRNDYPEETCNQYPDIARRHHRDMELVRRIAAALKGES